MRFILLKIKYLFLILIILFINNCCCDEEDYINEKQTDPSLKKNYEYMGLPNIGNTCYINSFLQCLFHTPNFIENLKKEDVENKPLCDILLKIYETRKQREKQESLFKQIKIKVEGELNYEQGDPYSFGGDLLEKLNEEIANINYDEEEEEEFRGDININKEDVNKLKTEKCKELKSYCKKYNTKTFVENMFGFHTIDSKYDGDILKYFHIIAKFHLELHFPRNNDVNFDLKSRLNFVYRDNPNSDGCTTQFCSFPDVLIFDLARKTTGMPYRKDEVTFYHTLDYEDIKGCIDVAFIENVSKFRYNLYAGIYKEGENPNWGHYYCVIKIDNKWYRFSDSQVTELDEIKLVSKKICFLFYQKENIIS